MYLQTPSPFLSVHPSPSRASAPSSLVRLALARSLCLPCNCPAAADWHVDCCKFSDAYILIRCRCVETEVCLHRIFTSIRQNHRASFPFRQWCNVRSNTHSFERGTFGCHFPFIASLSSGWDEWRTVKCTCCLKQMQHLFSFHLSALVTSPGSL